MNRKFVTITASALLSLSAFASVKVTSLDLTTNGATGAVKVVLDGRSQELPDLRVFGNTIEITIGQATAFEAISKNVRGAVLSANALNGKAVVRATLPYSVSSDSVNLSWKANGIEVSFPRGGAGAVHAPVPAGAALPTAAATVAIEKTTPVIAKPAAPAVKEAPKAAIKAPSKVSKEALNEDYLNKLMKENNAPAKKTEEAADHHKDEIKIQQAAPTTNALPSKVTDNFSFAGYAAKFTVFLALVLGLFYGIVQILKKGVFKKGKLGFLNNEKMIEVLSTTYIAPKKSLMIVRAHKQLFLVSSSETGLQFLSEMKDTTGIIKEGEKIITGTNFDTNLNFMVNATGDDEPAVKLKENIEISTPIEEPKSITQLSTKDIVKFSDELKKKAKKLRPIEFN